MKRRLGETKKMQWHDLTGQKFGKLTVQWPNGKNKSHGVYWLCLCECGKISSVPAERLKSREVRSCGCGPKHVTHGMHGTMEHTMWSSAKQRAKRKNIRFTIAIHDIKIPSVCPLLGIPLYRGKGRLFHDNSPSLDKKIPEFGYTPSNIWVISFRANRIKCNASLNELNLLVKNWEKMK